MDTGRMVFTGRLTPAAVKQLLAHVRVESAAAGKHRRRDRISRAATPSGAGLLARLATPEAGSGGDCSTALATSSVMF